MIDKGIERQGNVYSIYPLDQERAFTDREANDLIDLFIAITSKSKNEINALSSQLEYHKGMPHQADAIQFRLNQAIQKWSEKIRRLGGIPLALYKVKIPAVNGHYIWEFPNSLLESHLNQ